MAYLGELLSLFVSVVWTVASLACEVGSRRMGVVVLNVWRMGLALLLSLALMMIVLGSPWPVFAGHSTWLWLLASGVVGYFFGDWCLFNSYLEIGSRMGQLIMTLAPAFTALFAWVLIGQTLSLGALGAMCITLAGIGISITGGNGANAFSLNLPAKGLLFGLGAALGQGFGLVLSKIGVDHYTADIPAQLLPQIDAWIPFAANGIRCMAGLVCFTAWMLLRRETATLCRSAKDYRGMTAMIIAVITGPFVGVGCSLLALQYTAAGIASTLMSLTPILILWPSKWLFGQRITWRAVVGAIVSVIGVSLFFLI